MAGQIISYDRKAEQISLRDKDRVNWFTELSVNVSRLIQPFFYSDVTLKNKEIFTNLAIEKQGALIIPNHVEYMDSIAIKYKCCQTLKLHIILMMMQLVTYRVSTAMMTRSISVLTIFVTQKTMFSTGKKNPHISEDFLLSLFNLE